jgi:hypothetical protein
MSKHAHGAGLRDRIARLLRTHRPLDVLRSTFSRVPARRGQGRRRRWPPGGDGVGRGSGLAVAPR